MPSSNDSGFSALVMPMIFAHASSSGARAPTIVETAARTDRPLAVVWMNEWYQGPGSELLDADPKVCMFRSADRCFATLRAWFDWHERRDRTGSAGYAAIAAVRRAGGARDLLRSDAAAARRSSETDSKRILACYGIAIPQEILARDPEHAALGGRPDRRTGGDQDRIAGYPAQDRGRRCQAGAVDAGGRSRGGARYPGVGVALCAAGQDRRHQRAADGAARRRDCARRQERSSVRTADRGGTWRRSWSNCLAIPRCGLLRSMTRPRACDAGVAERPCLVDGLSRQGPAWMSTGWSIPSAGCPNSRMI